jgi:hypothetical protein
MRADIVGDARGADEAAYSSGAHRTPITYSIIT